MSGFGANYAQRRHSSGVDVDEQGYGTIAEPRLYQLIRRHEEPSPTANERYVHDPRRGLVVTSADRRDPRLALRSSGRRRTRGLLVESARGTVTERFSDHKGGANPSVRGRPRLTQVDPAWLLLAEWWRAAALDRQSFVRKMPCGRHGPEGGRGTHALEKPELKRVLGIPTSRLQLVTLSSPK